MLFVMDSLILFGTASVLIVSMVLNFWQYLQRRDASALVLEHRTFHLPEGWWSDPVRFQIERRAIFSQVTTLETRFYMPCKGLISLIDVDMCEPPGTFSFPRRLCCL
jgi:hypothetical protein